MSTLNDPFVPFVRSVLHPTDFSPASENAFAHALALALMRQTKLTILHAGRESSADWTNFPPVRATLERWGFLEPGSPKSAVYAELKVAVEKIQTKHQTPLSAIMNFLALHKVDVVVLSTEGREGVPRWVRPSVAEEVARKSEVMTLFVPKRGSGFIGFEDGSISLNRILIPVDHHPNPQDAVVYAGRTAEALGDEKIEITLLHVGDESSFPNIDLPHSERCVWAKVAKQGDIVDTITETARDQSAELIVMATEGHHGFLDAMRGSVTEQVVRRTACPLLAVPARLPR